MNVHTIVCPTDFSTSSEAAFAYASMLASESTADLYVLHVVDESAMYCTGFNGVGYIVDMAEQIEHEHLDKLEHWKPIVTRVPYHTVQLKGLPAPTILKFADQQHADLIVMGSHGRTGVSRLLMGSVAETVVRAAKCPVLTVKRPPDAATEQSRPHDLPPETVPP